MKVFLDTNVWLSAMVFPGLCAELLIALVDSEHEVLTSKLVQTETHEVLSRKFAGHEKASEKFDLLWADAQCIADVETPVDDADARLVAAAAQCGAVLFVTGDQRVLGWNPSGEMRIVSPRETWGLLFIASQ